MASNSIESFLKGNSPIVFIATHLLEYIQEIVKHCKDEVSWVMEATDLGDDYYEIDAVYIPTQRVNGATTEFDSKDIIKLMKDEPNFKPEKWRGWGHSHVNFGVTPSGQDKKMMLEFASTCEFFIGMIHNKRGEMFCWLTDNKRGIFFKDIEVCVISEYSDEVKKLLKERVTELKVETPPVTRGATTTTTRAITTTDSKSTAVPTPFMHKGYKLLWTTQIHNGVSQCGYEIGGAFFPVSKYNGPDAAIEGYEQVLQTILSRSYNDVLAEDTMPPAYQMEILDELDDFEAEVSGQGKGKGTF
jgi:hypothetical protein